MSSSNVQKKLTPYQGRLLLEVREIASLIGINYTDILDRVPGERTIALQLMRRNLIRGEVIKIYTVVEECLSLALCNYFFEGKRSSTLWKTDKFRNFNHYVVEVLSLNEKFRFFKAVTKTPKSIRDNIEHLIGVRNGLAHAYFPENLRSAKRVSPEALEGMCAYKGKDIFTLDGIRTFESDAYLLISFFKERTLD